MTEPEGIPPWARHCPTGKMKFASAADARAHMRGGRRKHALKGKVKTYCCPTCSSYHFSSATRTAWKEKFR